MRTAYVRTHPASTLGERVAAWVQAACAGIDQRSARPAWAGPGHHT